VVYPPTRSCTARPRRSAKVAERGIPSSPWPLTPGSGLCFSAVHVLAGPVRQDPMAAAANARGLPEGTARSAIQRDQSSHQDSPSRLAAPSDERRILPLRAYWSSFGLSVDVGRAKQVSRSAWQQTPYSPDAGLSQAGHARQALRRRGQPQCRRCDRVVLAAPMVEAIVSVRRPLRPNDGCGLPGRLVNQGPTSASLPEGQPSSGRRRTSSRSPTPT
jgi:hypothetical protein